MRLLQRTREDKASALALHLIAREALATAGVKPGANVAATCAEHGIARQQVYEEKSRIEAALAAKAVATRGRPARQGAFANPGSGAEARSLAACELRIAALEFRLANPGAVALNITGRATYNDAFKRFTLDAADGFVGTDEDFCRAVSVPYSTLMTWRQLDRKEPIVARPGPERVAVWPTGATPNELARTITTDFKLWKGDVASFLSDAARRLLVAPSAIRNVLRIAGMLAVDAAKPPRYRGSTLSASPGAIVVTDGKDVEIELTGSAGHRTVNWQGIVDQATACHLAVVVSKTEDAAAVGDAYRQTRDFLGKAPLALIHDQKSIYQEAALQKMITAETAMIPATLGRPENKAVIEGEFGKWEREVGSIVLDDTSMESLVTSAAREVVRAYTSGLNHAARAELEGKSRAEVIRDTCPDPKKDAALVAKLKADHQRGRHPAAPLPTMGVARTLLDEAFDRLGLVPADTGGRLRAWLAATFEPDAIRRALAIFEAKRAKGSLRGKDAHRYLVKLIREAQIEIDLEREERLLLKYAEIERRSWLAELIAAKTAIMSECPTKEEQIIALANHAVFGGIFLEKAFWEKELSAAIVAMPALLSSVTTHIRRLYEAPPTCRRRLLNCLVAAHQGLERPLT